MGSIWLVLALAFSLLIAIVALANQQAVEVSYLFGRAEVYLIILILGSAIAGAVAMGLFSLFRGIRTAFKFREERRLREELQSRVQTLEQEKLALEAELGRAVSHQAQDSTPGESADTGETAQDAEAPPPAGEESESEQHGP